MSKQLIRKPYDANKAHIEPEENNGDPFRGCHCGSWSGGRIIAEIDEDQTVKEAIEHLARWDPSRVSKVCARKAGIRLFEESEGKKDDGGSGGGSV